MVDLPPELWELVFSFGEGVSLLALRLVSKTTKKLAFKAFAQAYLSHIYCFLRDERRLERLRTATLNDQSAKAIKKVSLTLDPLEHFDKDAIPFAARYKRGSGPLEHRMLLALEQEQSFLRRSPPRNSAVYGVLRALKGINCTVALQLLNLIFTSDWGAEILLQIAIMELPIQELALRHSTVGELRLQDQQPHNDLLRASLKSVTALRYEINTTYSNWGMQEESARLLIASPESLQSLNIGFGTGHFAESMTLGNGAGRLLQANSFQALKHLRLHDGWFKPRVLIAALEKCRPTLSSLHLDVCHLIADVGLGQIGQWEDVFRTIISMPNLNSVLLRCLSAGAITPGSSMVLDHYAPLNSDGMDHRFCIEMGKGLRQYLQDLLDLGLQMARYKVLQQDLEGVWQVFEVPEDE